MNGHEVVGHQRVLERLAREGDDASLGHAILFTGPAGVGKTTTAFSLAVHLLDAARWPGGAIAHPDLWLEDGPAENLSIERLRAGGREAPTLQDFLALRPFAGGCRVAVLGRADRLTEQAANCILKTVEEPPPRTHLLLAAAHPERLPATVVSRCEQVGLHPVPADAIAGWLRRGHGVAEDLAGIVAALAAGAPGRALRLATEPGALAAELDALDGFLAAAEGGVSAALRAAAAAAPPPGAEGREQGLATLAAWASFVRDAACFAAGAPELGVWSAYRPALERWAEDLPVARIHAILGRIVQTSEAVASYAQPRLAFEALLLDIFGGADAPPVVELPVRATAVAEISGGATPGTRPRPRAGRRGSATAASSRSR